jgi:hypothetical protein
MLRVDTGWNRWGSRDGLPRGIEQSTNAILERRRHVRRANASQLFLEATLEVSAREATLTRAEVPLDFGMIAVVELVIEVLGEEPKSILATQDGVIRHRDSVVTAV